MISDEGDIIGIFRERLGNSGLAPEDLETFSLGGASLAMNVDTLVESTDMPPGFGLDLAGRKSVVACVSDFAAKGARPRFGAISVTLPRRLSRRDVCLLADGIAAAAKEFGVRIIGGDTNEGEELSLSVFLVGAAESVPTRAGAGGGDAVFVTGSFGYAAAGLGIILGGMTCTEPFGSKARDAVFRPGCRLEFGVAARDMMTSSTDSSDGLSPALHEIARQSGRGITIDRVPSGGDLAEFAESNGTDPLDLVFHGGEEYELVFTARPDSRDRIAGLAARLGVPVSEIGRVTPDSGVRLGTGRHVRIPDRGWRHFARPGQSEHSSSK